MDTFSLISLFFLIMGVSLICIGTIESFDTSAGPVPCELEGLGGAGREKGSDDEDDGFGLDLGFEGLKERISNEDAPYCVDKERGRSQDKPKGI